MNGSSQVPPTFASCGSDTPGDAKSLSSVLENWYGTLTTS